MSEENKTDQEVEAAVKEATQIEPVTTKQPYKVEIYFSDTETLIVEPVDRVSYTAPHYIIDQGPKRHVIPHIYQQFTMHFKE
jgi:hypothetical protein